MAKKKTEVFNTAILGFKKMKKTTLSFDNDIWDFYLLLTLLFLSFTLLIIITMDVFNFIDVIIKKISDDNISTIS